MNPETSEASEVHKLTPKLEPKLDDYYLLKDDSIGKVTEIYEDYFVIYFRNVLLKYNYNGKLMFINDSEYEVVKIISKELNPEYFL